MDSLTVDKQRLNGMELERRQLIEEQIVRRKRIHTWIVHSDKTSDEDDDAWSSSGPSVADSPDHTSSCHTHFRSPSTNTLDRKNDSDSNTLPAKMDTSSLPSFPSSNHDQSESSHLKADQAVQTESLEEHEYLRSQFEHNRKRLQVRFEHQLAAQRRRQQSQEHLHRLHQKNAHSNAYRHHRHKSRLRGKSTLLKSYFFSFCLFRHIRSFRFFRERKHISFRFLCVFAWAFGIHNFILTAVLV
jgi:hypothetical protein